LNGWAKVWQGLGDTHEDGGGGDDAADTLRYLDEGAAGH